MVFVKRHVAAPNKLMTVDLGADVPKDKVPQQVNQAAMAAILTQLSLLSAHAHDMFKSLVNEASTTYGRIKNLADRTTQLTSRTAQIEQGFAAVPPAKLLEKMNNTARGEYTAPDPEKHQHLSRPSIPPPVLATYEQCSPPPQLQLLDPCTDDGKACLSKYTNPEFFIEKWIEEQQKQVEAMKAERKRRREEKRLAMGQNEQGTTGAKPIKKLRKVKYDPETGKKIIEEEDEEVTTAAPNTATTRPAATTSNGGENSAPATPHDDTPTPRSGKSSKSTKSKEKGSSKSSKSSKTKDSGTGNAASNVIDPPPTTIAPAPPTDSSSTAADIPPPPMNVMAPPPPPMLGSAVPPPPPMMGGPAPPPPPPMASGGPSPPPPPPMGGPAPPPPPPPAASGGGDRGGLLDQIRGGASLKKAEAAPVGDKPVDTRSSLLENIRAGISLKSAGDRKPAGDAPAKKESAPTSVAEILARRIAIAGSDSDDDAGDDDDWD